MEDAHLSDDYLDDLVPAGRRRHPVTMGLLWITMVTGFASVLVGFAWDQKGFVYSELIVCLATSNMYGKAFEGTGVANQVKVGVKLMESESRLTGGEEVTEAASQEWHCYTNFIVAKSRKRQSGALCWTWPGV